ncbi:MAG: 6-phosphofructokinase [bacterium]|nr:6-phosphofructokinase [bacterium]
MSLGNIRERDPYLLAADTLTLADELVRSSEPDKRAAALALYQSLSEAEGAIGQEARAQVEALQGRGAWGRRAEIFANNFLDQITDPNLLVSLGVASTVYKATYAGIFSRALGKGPVGFGRLWGSRALAGTMGLAAEGPALVMTEHALREFTGASAHTLGGENFGDQVLSAWITLGMLRSYGFVGRSLSGAPLAGQRSLHQMLMPQAAMFGGIYTAFGIQEGLGLRQNAGADARLFDSLGFLFVAQTAGHLSRRLMGNRWRQFESQLDHHIRQTEWKISLPNLGGNSWATQAAGAAMTYGPKSPGGLSVRDLLVFSESVTGSRGSSRPPKPLGPEVIRDRFELMIRPEFRPGIFQKGKVPLRTRKGQAIRRVALLTNGGDGPAENALIGAFVQEAINRYGLEVVGVYEGFKGLMEPQGRIRVLDLDDVETPTSVRRARQQLYGNEEAPQRQDQRRLIAYLGGNILRSSRTNPIQEEGGRVHADQVQQTMRDLKIDALVVIGGNGTQRAAQELSDLGVDLVFIPQSIDADIPGSVVSVGFPSAVNRGALEIPEFLNTAQSCNRWFLSEIMGQHYGLLTLGIAHSASRGRFYFREGKEEPPVRVGGVFTEIPRSLGEIPEIIRRNSREGNRHGVILISEGVKFHEGVPPRARDNQGRIMVEAGDISRWVRMKLLENPHNLTNTRAVSLGYSLRGARPNSHDILLASQFAKGALELIESGAFGRMVGLDFVGRTAQWTMNFPRISDALAKPLELDPQYYEFIRHSLEGE